MDTNETIRVLQVGMSPYYGGTESFLMNQYRCIDRSRVQFDFLNVYDREIACQKEIESLGGHIYHLDMARHKGLKNYRHNMDAFFKENAGKIDVIHCNFQSLINVDALKYARKYGIPVRIAHAHNAGYGTEPSALQKMLIRKNRVAVNKYATHFFACSELAARWMFGREATIINNAIDTDKFTYNPETRERVRRELSLEDKPTVIFVGRLDPQKNPLFLLEVFYEIFHAWADAQLLVVGDGIMKNEMEEKISQLGLNNSVRMLGTRDDVNELLQAADIFLLPSRFEGLGIVLIEAQAAGVRTYTSKDVVPRSVKITNLLEFISLDKSAKEWADTITKQGIEPHSNVKRQIVDAGYDNIENTKVMVSLYRKFRGLQA